MTRREKRRRMQRMLTGLFAAAAVLVPTAPAAIVHDDPADRAAIIQGLCHRVRVRCADDKGRPERRRRGASRMLRRDAPDGRPVGDLLDLCPQSGSGSEFDWSASGLGAATAALLLALGFAGYRLASRGGMAHQA